MQNPDDLTAPGLPPIPPDELVPMLKMLMETDRVARVAFPAVGVQLAFATALLCLTLTRMTVEHQNTVFDRIAGWLAAGIERYRNLPGMH